MIYKSLFIPIVCLLAACTSEDNKEAWTDWQSLSSEEVMAQLSGTWRNEVLGHLAVFSADGAGVFHELDDFCIEDTGVVPDFSIVRFHDSLDAVQLYYYDYRDSPALLQNPLDYVRVNETPQACLDQSDVETARLIDVFDLVWRFYDRYYGFFEERNVDWESLKAEFRPLAAEAKTESELFDVLAKMLGHLNDSHLNLRWESRSFNAGRPKLRARLAEAWAQTDKELTEGAFVGHWANTVKTSVLGLFDEGTYKTGANGALEWGVIDQETGYLRINRFSGFLADSGSRQAQIQALRDALSLASTDLQSSERLIVDVSHNGGGNDAAAMTVVEHFLDVTRDVLEYAAPGAPMRRVRLTPSQTFHQNEVLLLTSEITVSAAEAFVLMMKTLPQVQHVGGTTRGALSGLLPKPLPRGFLVTISYQDVLDAEGQLFEGRGIPPDQFVQLFPPDDLFGGYRKEIARLATGR